MTLDLCQGSPRDVTKTRGPRRGQREFVRPDQTENQAIEPLIMNMLHRALLALAVAIVSLGLISQQPRGRGVRDTEIRIGNLMPYTGALAAFAAIGKAESAYFDMINERGGINGRKVRFISHDNNSDPSTALDLT